MNNQIQIPTIEQSPNVRFCVAEHNGLIEDVYSKYLVDSIEESIESFDKLRKWKNKRLKERGGRK